MFSEIALIASFASECPEQVKSDLIKGIMDVESSLNPLAIQIDGMESASQPDGIQEAIAIAEDLHQKKIPFKAGLFQYPSTELEYLGLNLNSVFNSCDALAVANQKVRVCDLMLADYDHDESRDKLLASCFKYGDFEKGFDLGDDNKSYVEKVIHAQGKYLDVKKTNTQSSIEEPEIVSNTESIIEPKVEPKQWDVFGDFAK